MRRLLIKLDFVIIAVATGAIMMFFATYPKILCLLILLIIIWEVFKFCIQKAKGRRRSDLEKIKKLENEIYELTHLLYYEKNKLNRIS